VIANTMFIFIFLTSTLTTLIVTSASTFCIDKSAIFHLKCITCARPKIGGARSRNSPHNVRARAAEIRLTMSVRVQQKFTLQCPCAHSRNSPHNVRARAAEIHLTMSVRAQQKFALQCPSTTFKKSNKGPVPV
jgi:hypothetical protein